MPAAKVPLGTGAVRPYISVVKANRAKYRRRRLGALFVAGALAVTMYTAGGVGAEPHPRITPSRPGTRCGAIAIEHTPPWEDPRPRVEAIREANDLSGYEIYPGMSLELPPVRLNGTAWYPRHDL